MKRLITTFCYILISISVFFICDFFNQSIHYNDCELTRYSCFYTMDDPNTLFYYHFKSQLEDMSIIPVLDGDFSCQITFSGEDVFELYCTWQDPDDPLRKITFHCSPHDVLDLYPEFDSRFYHGVWLKALRDTFINSQDSRLYNIKSGELYYSISTTNVSESEVASLLRFVAKNNPDLSKIKPGDGMFPIERYANYEGLEEAIRDETFGRYIPDIPIDFISGQREYSYLDCENGWLIDEMHLIYRSGLKECTVYISLRDTWGKNGFAGSVIERKELDLNSVAKHINTNVKGTKQWISLGVYSGDVFVHIEAEGFEPEEVLQMLESVKQ